MNTASNVKFLITDSNITVNFDGETHIVARGDALANKLIAALRSGNHENIPNLVSTGKRIENFSEGNFVVKDGDILVNGIKAPDALGKKIVKFANDGLPYQPLVRFAENLQRNPSQRSVDELFLFLEANEVPLTERGTFIAYKRVRGDFKDIYTGTFDNSPGNVVEMSRQEVDPDANKTCSVGLHVANFSYAHQHYASKDASTDVILEVEVDPSDVVSVPVDYSNSKMRVSKYRVLGVIDKQHSKDLGLRIINKDEPVVEEIEEECEMCEEVGCDGSCEEECMCESCDEEDCY